MSKSLIVVDTFMKDLIKLTKKEQKQTAKTMRLMETNIKHPSLNFHKVESTNFHEVYVNMDIRIVLEVSTDFYVLRYVGHHDMLDKL